MSRACCCSVSHADVISSITTIQDREDAMGIAKIKTIQYGETHYGGIVLVLEQVVGDSW